MPARKQPLNFRTPAFDFSDIFTNIAVAFARIGL